MNLCGNSIKICTGIVLFNPEINRLKDNIYSIIKQVPLLVLIDNKSDNIDQVKDLIKNIKNIILIENCENKGIAQALNVILEVSYKQGYDWVLTLDQDSVADEHLVEKYKEFIIKHNEISNVACLTCDIIDRNFSSNRSEKYFEYVDYCITSGSLMNITYTLEVGGFDELMFIDKVDTDICINLINMGYRIVKLGYPGLLHEIGHATQINLIFRTWEIYNHNSFRRYYMCRNASYLLIKYNNLKVFKIFCKEIFQTILVFIYENNKKIKLKKSIKGFIDGFKILKYA